MSDPMDFRLKHVSARRNRDGSLRFYFVRRGQTVTRLPGTPTSPEFMDAYTRLLDYSPSAELAREGTLAWLADRYMDSPAYTGKARATREARRRVIRSMMAERLAPGHPETFAQERIRAITPKHIGVLRDRKAATPNAANERLKILSQIFGYAVAEGLLDANPVRMVGRLAVRSGGHQTATDEDIARYYATHTSGPPWLAMKLLCAFGMRVSDLRVIGRQHVRKGFLCFKTKKTGMLCELEIGPEVAAILPDNGEEMTFLLSSQGKPFKSDKALSQRIAKWFRQAGVETATAHGVRKWLATRMAENGATELELCAWFGWRDPKEARPYVASANRRKLASSGMAKVRNV